ncbi:MAG: hypothetical protein K0R33_3612, partial [Mycobacterium sp.]|nr:hypothetical protein [Mycobacterium sp.]
MVTVGGQCHRAAGFADQARLHSQFGYRRTNFVFG